MEEPRYNFGLKTVLLSTQLLEDGTTLGSWRDARGAVVYLSNVLRTDVLCAHINLWVIKRRFLKILKFL